MQTKPVQEEICPVCGKKIEKNRESVLKECCSDQWIKQQIDNCYF
ncbi:hypothetical protein [Desmospora activa]|uniref:Uncharacterized protein n=1 Tax=Desmospora activa DSM 45169 TaxID=1121389 RepID=A0A2T4ZCQ2_9BACL|nr:hypothetical protein [Desmospora activa]PTM59675.1 hypothetical protein C8J48_2305 [Desmospora activa DSM 45169]